MAEPVPLSLSPERLEQLTDAVRLRVVLYPSPKPPPVRRRSRQYPGSRPKPRRSSRLRRRHH